MTSIVNGIEISTDDPSVRFNFISKVGEGSYGAVYKALDTTDGMIVAVKVLDLQSQDTSDLRKEINILKQCHSPYIVQYKGSFMKDGKIWIAMEFCDTGSLSDLMAICDTTLSEDQIASIMYQSIKGLDYLHSTKKIHRDLKSGNILLTSTGDCKLADFGVSAELTNTLAKRATMIGTPYFMAPEVLQSSQYDASADIWSIGITAYELAVGTPPLADIHPMRAIFLIPTSPSPTLPDANRYSHEFSDFLKVCLQKDPSLRPTAVELLKHPFVRRNKGKIEILNLIDNCKQQINNYRDEEAKEQRASNENQPGGKRADNNGTMVARGNNSDTLPAFQPTWTAGGADTAVVAQAAQLAGFSNNPMSTMVVRNQGTVLVSDNHLGTIRVSRKEMSTMVNHGTTVINPAAFSMDLNTHKTMNLFASVNEHSSATEIQRVLTQTNKAYEADVQAINAFYDDKVQKLRDLLAKKK